MARTNNNPFWKIIQQELDFRGFKLYECQRRSSGDNEVLIYCRRGTEQHIKKFPFPNRGTPSTIKNFKSRFRRLIQDDIVNCGFVDVGELTTNTTVIRDYKDIKYALNLPTEIARQEIKKHEDLPPLNVEPLIKKADIMTEKKAEPLHDHLVLGTWELPISKLPMIMELLEGDAQYLWSISRWRKDSKRDAGTSVPHFDFLHRAREGMGPIKKIVDKYHVQVVEPESKPVAEPPKPTVVNEPAKVIIAETAVPTTPSTPRASQVGRRNLQAKMIAAILTSRNNDRVWVPDDFTHLDYTYTTVAGSMKKVAEKGYLTKVGKNQYKKVPVTA